MTGGRIVVVTGAASGIGRACARRFAEGGDTVAAVDVDERGLADLADAGEGRIVALPGDVADEAQVAGVFAAVRRNLGPSTVLVAAAGVTTEGDVTATEPAAWRRVVDTCLTGTYLCCREAVAHMRDAGGGAIVTFGSVLGRATLPRAAAYTAAKAGIEALTRALALDGAPEGIRANCLVPGSVDTPMLWGDADIAGRARIRALLEAEQPAGRVAHPGEVAACVHFLASADASFVSGTSLVVDGGLLARVATSY